MVKIVTDSSCDLSLERCAELGVEMLPITVNFGEESYRANVDLTTEDFYDKLAQAKELPHTAQITPAFFEKKFKEYMEAGDQVVCLFISSQMSGTLQSATVAKGMLGATNIYLPDTLNVTFALGLLVEEAVKMRDRGLSAPQIVEEIGQLVPRVRLWALIEDLKYLKMGGRLSASSALVASILGICPIITLKDGLVEVVGKARGRKAAFAAIRKLVEKEPISSDYCVTVGHANVPNDVMDSLIKAKKAGVTVVVNSRVGTGMVTPVGKFSKEGFVSAMMHNPQKARILLMLALTKTDDPKEIQRIFNEY